MQASPSRLRCAVIIGAFFLAALPYHGPPALRGQPGAVAEPAQETPIGTKWWPSEWGQGDQRGAANRITPERVVAAAQLIRQGRIFHLGRMYEYGMPLPGKRHFSLTIPGSPTGEPAGKNRGVYFDEMFSGEIGQIGTQLDGLGHVGVRIGGDDYFYNGFRRSEFASAYGHKKLGIENAGVFFTRGILVDMPGFKGVTSMKIGEVITPADVEGALKKQGVTVREGDAVLFRTGHGQLWMKNNEIYGRGEPGLGMAAAQWLVDRKIVLVGSDTWAMEVLPPENPDRPMEVHHLLLIRHGVYILENLDLEELAEERIYEFAFILAPLKLKGATGSPGNPIAVR